MASRVASPTTRAAALAVLAGLVCGALSGVEPLYGLLFAFGVAFVLLVLADLVYGFAAMGVLAYLATLAGGGGVSLAKLAGIVLLAGWFGVVTTSRENPRNILVDHPGLTYVLMLFVGWAAVSVSWAEIEGVALNSVMRYALNILLVPIAYTAIRSEDDAVRVLGALVVGATFAGVSGIISAPTAGASDAIRATGTVGDANELAAGLVLGLGIAVAFLANRHLPPVVRALAGGAAAICLVGVLLSLSRGGLLGIGGATLAAVAVGGRWRGRVAAVAGAVVLLAVGYFSFLAPAPAKERVTNVGGGTGRLDLWTVAERMIDAHPIRGVGTGQYPNTSVHYLLEPGAIKRADYILSAPKVAHNTYLNITAELGIVGGLLFAGLVATCLWCTLRAARILRDTGDERLEILVRGFAVGLIGYLVTLLFISEMYSKLMWVALGVGPALLAVARAKTTAPGEVVAHDRA